MWACATLLVAVGWLVTPHPVTVYDGIGQPDEPYRYASPPVGAKLTPKPLGASDTTQVVGGVNATLAWLDSKETGSQVSVYLPIGVLAAAGGTISASVVPEAPTDQPDDGPIDGNVYRVSITNPAGPVTFTSATSTIYLRAITARQPGPVMVHRLGPGHPWRVLETNRSGNEIYGGVLPEAGEYALVYSKRHHSGAATDGTARRSAGGGHQGLIVILLGSLVFLLSVVLAVRWRARQVDP
jgi:hypothetical protein